MVNISNHFDNGRKGIIAFFKWLVFSVAIGLIVGIFAVMFHFAIETATELRLHHKWLLYLLPIGGLGIIWLYKITGMENHRGTNLVLNAVRSNEKLSFKTAPLIFISTVITHLFGGSSGREGAALQIGASISSKIGRMMHLNEKDARIMTMCGMSAAFSALFGTPIAAVVFSMEVVNVGVMYYAALVSCVISAVVGLGVAGYMGVAPERFTVLEIPDLSILSVSHVLGIAVLCALVSILFCVAMEKTGEIYGKFFKNKYTKVFVGGLIVVILSLIVGTDDYNGAGVEVIHMAFSGEAKPWAFLLKILFTAITLRAGFKGGEIVPAFFTGATFGNVAARFFGISPSFGAGIGLVAVFCGVTNCPITSIILSVELLGAQGLIFYAIACAVSYMLSGYFSLYNEQKIVYSKLTHDTIED